MHRPLASCIVWDGGNGMLESSPYHEAPVWAQQEKGRPAFLLVEDMTQRYVFAECRALFAQLRLASQQKAFILSPRGSFWRVAHHAAFDETRAGVRAIAGSHGFVVIEGGSLGKHRFFR